MTAYEELLQDIEAKRDMAYMDAKDARVEAETLDYVASMLRNAIKRDAKDSEA